MPILYMSQQITHPAILTRCMHLLDHLLDSIVSNFDGQVIHGICHVIFCDMHADASATD